MCSDDALPARSSQQIGDVSPESHVNYVPGIGLVA